MDPVTTSSAIAAASSLAAGSAMPNVASPPPQLAMLDFFFPGFSVFSSAVQRYLGIDLNIYIPLLMMCGGLTFAWNYFSEYFWGIIETHMMSTVEIRTDDEIYNIIMSWVAAQQFSQGARRFVVNTNLRSRSWFVWRYEDDDDEDGEDGESPADSEKKKKVLSYTPSFGSHTFWYRGRLLLFKRSANQQQSTYMVVSEREEISICCFGRNPWILKELLLEARQAYVKKDEAKTLIYRGTLKMDGGGPSWQRCMSRTSRPLSTVVLNEKVKKDLIDDISDYLNPATRRWYSNRGIPYRRGYLLHGPPGTGKSSLSLAVAGLFKMRIYMVSLSSGLANEESLASLFAELPRRCVVLLEDIDTAGLTHTRDDSAKPAASSGAVMTPGQVTPGVETKGSLSLSGLLNILDGVASQEGRVLIMTTNHVEKLDKALIRPGRVDMIVKFDKADSDMCAAIFRAIFATLEGDEPSPAEKEEQQIAASKQPPSPEEEAAAADKAAKRRAAEEARIFSLAQDFSAKIPAHEFSPAEIQGYLLKNKRDPEGAVSQAEAWVVDTRKEKAEKELREAEEKRQAEQKAKEAEEQKKKDEEGETKDEEEKKQKESQKKEKKRRAKKAKKAGVPELSDDPELSAESNLESSSGSEAEVAEDEKGEKRERRAKTSKAAKSDDTSQLLKEPLKGQCGADSGYGSPS